MKITKLICDHCGSQEAVKPRKVQVGILPESFYPETIQYIDIDLCEECARFVEDVVGDIAEDESYLTKKQVLGVMLQLLCKEDVKEFFNKQKDLSAINERKKDVRASILVNGLIKLGPLLFKNGETKHLLLSPGSERVVLSWNNAVKYCGGKVGWVLPTKEELNLIIKHKDLIDSVDPSEKGKFSDIDNNWIWSSSESSSYGAWIQSPSDGNQYPSTKYTDWWVIPVRLV